MFSKRRGNILVPFYENSLTYKITLSIVYKLYVTWKYIKNKHSGKVGGYFKISKISLLGG